MLRFQLYDATGQKGVSINEADTLLELCQDLEYGDVAEGHYLVLDTLDGVTYQLDADREVKGKDYYSVPMVDRGIIWQPTLGDIGQ